MMYHTERKKRVGEDEEDVSSYWIKFGKSYFSGN